MEAACTSTSSGHEACTAGRVQGYPTIKSVVGGRVRDYNGERSASALKSFALSLLPDAVSLADMAAADHSACLAWHRLAADCSRLWSFAHAAPVGSKCVGVRHPSAVPVGMERVHASSRGRQYMLCGCLSLHC